MQNNFNEQITINKHLCQTIHTLLIKQSRFVSDLFKYEKNLKISLKKADKF